MGGTSIGMGNGAGSNRQNERGRIFMNIAEFEKLQKGDIVVTIDKKRRI